MYEFACEVEFEYEYRYEYEYERALRTQRVVACRILRVLVQRMNTNTNLTLETDSS